MATRPHPKYPHFKLVYDLSFDNEPISSADRAAYWFHQLWPDTIHTEASLMVFMLNVNRQIIAYHHVQLGNPNYQIDILSHLRMISWMAAHSCASSVYLGSNITGAWHVDDNTPIPQHAWEALQRIGPALNTIDIWLEDHLLLTPIGHQSLKERLGADWTFADQIKNPSLHVAERE